MSERDEFEAWAEPQGILLGRVVSDDRYESMTTEWAYRAWQAARATQAVPALTDEQIDWEHLYNEMAKRYADACSEIARLDLVIRGFEATDERIENAAIALWHRFAPDHHMEWEGEAHKAEYRDAASAILAAPQPSPEPAHAHDWRFSLQDHLYKCDCGATRGDYPFGAASFKD